MLDLDELNADLAKIINRIEETNSIATIWCVQALCEIIGVMGKRLAMAEETIAAWEEAEGEDDDE